MNALGIFIKIEIKCNKSTIRFKIRINKNVSDYGPNDF